MAAPTKVTKRKSPVPVPDVANTSDDGGLDHIEDPAERKRVLNVLAQRRYRRRKREHQLELQMQIERQKQIHRNQPLSQSKGLALPDWDTVPGERLDSSDELQYLRRRVAQLEAALYAKSLDNQSNNVSLGSPQDPFDTFGGPTVVEHSVSASSESDAGTFGPNGILDTWMLAPASSSQEHAGFESVSRLPCDRPKSHDLPSSLVLYGNKSGMRFDDYSPS
ncbi:hypothetical protein DRE_00912 [Drechslerella stenobrocha 248]|uniref:BZIP domain-containing protein n=1 Tax=Drechslerella stenobrocha 248 TaxID=1043628 RepID=W7HY39_9PEZI|nr:hypothetical protein DRE_00912 [Drechslerella stenobrocha 248]